MGAILGMEFLFEVVSVSEVQKMHLKSGLKLE
jgi:hypothetical protein